MIDVTDATFEQAVLERSTQVPVVVDLWAPWCGPCRTLGPMIEEVVAATKGAVDLAKVNVDENPQVAAAFQVQSIPAVFALKDRAVVDTFVGAVPRAQIEAFVARLAAAPSEVDLLVAAGDEASLRKALELEPDHAGAITALAQMELDRDDPAAALELLARIPETGETRRVAALARLAAQGVDPTADLTARLDALLERVKGEEQARKELLDLLETLGPEDPRAAQYRRAMATRLF